MKSIAHGLRVFAASAVLMLGVSQMAEAQAYLKRFMPVCEHVVASVSPGSPPAAVCACTARRGFAAIAANPQTAAAVLQAMQTYNTFALTGAAYTTPDQQAAMMSAMTSLSAAYASCVAQPY